MIYKYTLDRLKTLQKIQLPEGSEILSCQMRGANLVLWAVVDVNERTTDREFLILMTGEAHGLEGWMHLATIQDGPIVVHVFEGYDE